VKEQKVAVLTMLIREQGTIKPTVWRRVRNREGLLTMQIEPCSLFLYQKIKIPETKKIEK